jgi:hypothetical protein
VRGIYTTLDVPSGTLAVPSLGDVQDVELLITPRKLDPGSYSVSTTRRGKDLYQLVGTQLYVVTRYCYHYGYADKATLEWSSYGTAGAGKLTWE